MLDQDVERGQMRAFGPGHPADEPEPGPVPLSEVPGPVRATFSAFAEKLAADGFAFLNAHVREGSPGPVSGRLRQRSYEIKEGEERTVYEVVVDETDDPRDGMRGARWHHGATLPCHQQKQQTVTAAWAGWKPCCPIGNSGPIVY